MDPGANTDFQHEAVAPNGAVLLGFFSQAQSFRPRRKISGGGNDGCPRNSKSRVPTSEGLAGRMKVANLHRLRRMQLHY
jgi:hypothetical protein